jgi:hypothetical protein
MLKLFPLKIPVESDIGIRFKAEAEKAGLTYWELLGRMLKTWESQPSAQLPLFLDDSSERITALEAQIKEIKDMVANMVTMSKKQVEAQIAPESLPNLEEATQTVTITKEEPTISETEQFEAAYAKLERDGHALIWQLREALDWPIERVDAVIRQLRDAGQYQPMQGAEIAKMKKKQLQSAFRDENGFRHHAIMRVPPRAAAPITAPMGATAPVAEAPAPRKRGRPKKSV